MAKINFSSKNDGGHARILITNANPLRGVQVYKILYILNVREYKIKLKFGQQHYLRDVLRQQALKYVC